jgi:two-component system, NtrC family, response regulator
VQPIGVLVFEDNEVQRKVIEFNLSREGYDVKGAGTIISGMALMKEHKPDVVITDVMLPDGNGIELLEKLLSIEPDLPVIVVTAYGTIRMAVDAIKKGAHDYITKPYEKEELLFSVKRALEGRGGRPVKEGYNIIGRSDAIKKIIRMIDRIADSDVPVLITGESGTGKEIVARAIHNASNRKDMPFVAINCAAIPSNLLEAELFGYTKGAFTGAVKDKPGKFALADRGVLFLDEIGSLDVSLQPKLLRAIETGSIERLGDITGKHVDARIVSATNADLAHLIKRGGFREDLYYRLNVVPLSIPPLRDRREDIPLLVEHFIKEYAHGGGFSIGRDAMDMITDRAWYGNVRELENFIRRLAVMKGSGTITGDDVASNLPRETVIHGTQYYGTDESPNKSMEKSMDESMDEAEKRMIRSALERAGHNMSKAAKILKIPRHKLIYRMKKYGIE